jgi:DNA-binding transcriptional ArsR family regulator
VSQLRDRMIRALEAVLPTQTPTPRVEQLGTEEFEVSLPGISLRAAWLDRGSAKTVKDRLVRDPAPDVLMAPRMSAGAREAAARHGIGWLDESGAAEFAVGNVVVSRTGQDILPRPAADRWTKSTIGTAEALLLGVPATVNALKDATGVSPGTIGPALNRLTRAGLLTATAARGRHSGRVVTDAAALLSAYVDAVQARRPALEVQAGALWRNPLQGLTQAGKLWSSHGICWAATGALSAAVLAPLQTQIAPLVVYIDATTTASLADAARRAELHTLEGGRLTMRPFPSTITQRLSHVISPGLNSVPWPRAYADLLTTGVRGEDAAEHLREVMTRDIG